LTYLGIFITLLYFGIEFFTFYFSVRSLFKPTFALKILFWFSRFHFFNVSTAQNLALH